MITKLELINLIKTTYALGDKILRKDIDLQLFNEYQRNIINIKHASQNMTQSDHLLKIINDFDWFNDEKYTINWAGKLYYYFAAFRTHELHFMTRNTLEHKMKRYLFDNKFRLDYLQGFMD